MHKKQPKFVTLTVLTTVTIVSWVFYSLYGVLVKAPEITAPRELMVPFEVTLDNETLSRLESRIYFTENQTRPLPIEGD